MSPIARQELERYTRRIRKESRARNRQFAQPSPLMQIIADYWWVPVSVWLVYGWWKWL